MGFYKRSLINYFSQLPAITYVPIVLIVIFYIFNRNFLSPMNISRLIGQSAPLIIVSLGNTIPIMGGGVDISVGALMGLSGTIVALSTNAGLSLPIALILAIAVATICGLISGILIGMTNLAPMVTTFGMSYIVTGINLGITAGGSIAITSKAFNHFARGAEFLGIPAILWVVILYIVVVDLILRATFYGGHLYAIGVDPIGAKALGVKVNIHVVSQYGISGFLAGVAGLVLASRLLTGNALVGAAIPFESIAAVVVGGTLLGGGEGTVFGTVMGALIISILKSGLALFGIYPGSMAIIIGVVLVIVVVSSQLLYTRIRRRSGKTIRKKGVDGR